jgi:hypothetical protein
MFGDFSNGFGQALNVLGLSFTAGGVPAAAVDFLLAQQCPAGAFRLFYDDPPVTRGCVDDAQADTDATSLAVQALVAVDHTSTVHTAVQGAVHWLLAHQDPATGGFGGAGPTASINSNTTGLAAQALRAAGELDAAGRAAAHVHGLELSHENTHGTPAAGDEGAIALNQGAFDEAHTNGITSVSRDQWHRATTQGVLAYGLPAFGPGFVATEGARLLDTRPGTGTIDGKEVGAGRVAAGTTRCSVAGAACAVQCRAVVLNITATDSSGSGYLTAPVRRCSSQYVECQLRCRDRSANAVITKLAAGTPCASSSAGPTSSSSPTSPVPSRRVRLRRDRSARLLDTRPGTATIDGKAVGAGAVAGGTTLVLPVGGRGGVPSSAAAAVLDIIATDSTGPGYVTVYPCDATRPNASSVNFAAGTATANAVITKLAADGTVCLFVSGSDVQLVADVAGSFPGGSDYEAIDPARLLDTRPGTATVDGQQTGAGAVEAGTTLVLPIAGRGRVPADATAVALDIVAADSSGSGYVTVYPCDASRPNTSSVNFAAGITSANAVITKLAADGTVCLFVSGADTQLVADVVGSFM